MIRTVAPAIAELSSDLSVHPEVLITPSGARLHVFQNSVQPVIRIEFVFKGGKWYQPFPGVASLTAKMLKEGTLHHSAKQIADITDFYGASLEVSHGFDRTTVTLYCLSKFLPDLLPLTFEIIEQPSFPQEEFDLLKQRIIQSLAVDKQKNSYLSTETFTTAIYGKGHPYATFTSEEEVAAVQKESLASFHQKAYNYSTAEVFITGDINNQAFSAILEKLNASSSQTLEEPLIAAKALSPRLIIDPTSNQMQAAIRVGKSIIKPTHPDYPALYLLNHTLGGYFGSRLMKNIREEKGYTYGVYSSLSQKEHDSLFSLGTDIKGDKIEETLEEISKELDKLKQEEVTEEELTTVKKHLAGKFLSDHATLFDKMDKYKSNVLLRLPADFYTNLLKEIQSLSADQLKEAAKNYLSEEDFFKVVTGGTPKG
ncbi:M16 family metallopeptidase [Rufibacter radiotolerans]|uniref:M16 family metallopeptidase n=1 Tax=Rufibacter radiotolerans TaxID=1379910 RepID=UPI0018CCC54E|nr:pitrilysin family protein [Rufibacter radiotolerans]